MEGEVSPGTRSYADFNIRSPFRSYLRTVRDVLVEPEQFFRTIRGSGLWGPTLFVLITYALIPILVAPFILLSLILAISHTEQLNPNQTDAVWQLLLFSFTVLILVPLGGILITVVGTLLWHMFVLIFVGPGRGEGYRETYRIGAYLSLPYLISNLIPLIGPILALGVTGYVGVAGVKGAHSTTKVRAAMSVFLPMFLGISALLLTTFVLVASVDPPAGFGR